MSNISSAESPGTTILASAPAFAGMKWTFGSLTDLYSRFPKLFRIGKERVGVCFVFVF